MHDEEFLLFIVVPLVLFALVAAPIISMVLALRLRREQKRQGELLETLLKRSANVTAARAETQKPAVLPEPARQPAPLTTTPAQNIAPPTPAPAIKPLTIEFPPFVPPPPKPKPQPGPLQAKANEILRKIWNWIIIGEEFRKPGTSWEFAVATNWLLRLGIVAVVIGVGFFLKYSIDHGMLRPTARVALSVLTGIAMLGGGVRLVSKPYQLFGQGLMGGGLAVLYFSMFAACNFYHLIGALAAFGLMALVTLTAGVLAVRLNSLLVAVLGILGGYGTPVMLSTGAKNFPGLFGYLMLLGVGILGIAHCRRWLLLNYLGLVLTYGLATVAIDRQYAAADLAVVLPFLVGFFLLYSAVMFFYNIAHREKATVPELLGILINALMFFSLGRHVITTGHPGKFAALLALGLAAFFIVLVWLFLARRQQDRGLLFTFLALAAFFVAITPPLALSRQWVTASWALQGLVMLWLAGRLESRFLRLLGCAAFALTAGRLAFWDLHAQFSAPLAADATGMIYMSILGERLMAVGVPIAALGGAWKLLRRPPAKGELAVAPENDLASAGWQPTIAGILAAFGVGLLCLYAHFELYRTCGFFWPALAVPSMTVVWFALGLFLLALGRSVLKFWMLTLLAIVGVAMIFKLLFVDMAGWPLNSHAWLYGGDYTCGLVGIRIADYSLCLALLAMIFTQTRRDATGRPLGLAAGIAALALLFLYLTLELNTALNRFVPGLRAGGITLLWAAYALTLLLYGLGRAVRGLRYASLAIFTVVVGKIFLSDMANLDALYRIAAFLILGVILLAAALVYLKNRQNFQTPTTGEKHP